MRVRRGVAALDIALAVGATLATATGVATSAVGQSNSGAVVAGPCPPEKERC